MKHIVLILSFLLAATFAYADSGSFFGVRTGYYTDAEGVFLGGEYLTGIAQSVDFNPNIEYVFVDNMTLMTFNIDAHYDFYEKRGKFVYLGAGLGFAYTKVDGFDKSDTKTGLNLLFGTGINRKPVIPYFQAKIMLGDVDDFVLTFGLRF